MFLGRGCANFPHSGKSGKLLIGKKVKHQVFARRNESLQPGIKWRITAVMAFLSFRSSLRIVVIALPDGSKHVVSGGNSANRFERHPNHSWHLRAVPDPWRTCMFAPNRLFRDYFRLEGRTLIISHSCKKFQSRRGAPDYCAGIGDRQRHFELYLGDSGKMESWPVGRTIVWTL